MSPARPPLRTAARSVGRTTARGTTRRFSSRDDLVAATTGDPDWPALFQEWVRQGATACRFAQHRAHHLDEAHYTSIVVEAPLDEAAVDDLQQRLCDATDAAAVFVHVPGATTVDAVAELIAALVCSQHWFATTASYDPPDPGHVSLGVRWPLPGSRHVSEVLGFADLTSMPVTRRAPVTTLVLRTHATVADGDEIATVHLAQMPYLTSEEPRVDAFWQQTLADKADLLAGELVHAAEAPITCRLPVIAWREAKQRVHAQWARPPG